MLTHVNSRSILKALEADGWVLKQVTGSHLHYSHPAKPGLTTAPHPKKDLPVGTVKAIERLMQGVVNSRTSGGADPVQGRHYYRTSHNPNLKSRPSGNGRKGAARREKVFARFGPFHDSISPKRQTYIYIYNAPGQQ